MKKSDEFDYVVIGAGSAGCAVAARLSEDAAVTVLVLEAGGRDTLPWIHVPIGYARTMFDKRVNWCYRTEAEPGMDGRQLHMPAGKVLGGSSSINGLLYVRGQHEDYDGWERLGNAGWGAADVLPYFKRSEFQENGPDAWHGAAGPLHVSSARTTNPLCDAFIAAAGACGIPLNKDFNGARQEGVGYYQLTARNGRRASSSVAFLRPAMRRPNVRVETRSLVSRLAVSGGRVTSVQVRSGDGERHVRARRAVVLCAGALASPALLLRSGIGAPEKLQGAGVKTVHQLPGVGENLQDHVQAKLIFRSALACTLNDEYASLAGKLRIARDYLFHRRGWLTSAAGQAGGFVRTDPGLARPDLQFHVMGFSATTPQAGLDKFSGFTISACQLRPESRGSVTIRSANPAEAPVLAFNYLQSATDRQVLLRGLRMAREIAASQPLSGALVEEVSPGARTTGDEQLLAYTRSHGGSVFHPAGTCRMGTDTKSVVDSRLRVHGLEGLYVADASVMPTLVSGNTNAATIMIGERAADFLKEAR